jgi:hypothetical protein
MIGLAVQQNEIDPCQSARPPSLAPATAPPRESGSRQRRARSPHIDTSPAMNRP